MPIKNIKSIFRPGKPAAILLTSLLDETQDGGCLHDLKENVIAGTCAEHSDQRYDIMSGDSVIGYFYGPVHLAELVNFIVSKELEKKTLGSEILTLYREINLIYNFSEALSKAGSKEAIGKLALEQSR